MAQHGAALQNFNCELVKCLENLKCKRIELQSLIDLEEIEKAKLQSEIDELSNKLSLIMVSLSKKQAARNEYDRAIVESESAYCKILESSQTLVNIVRRECANLDSDELHTSKATCPCPQGTEMVVVCDPPACSPPCLQLSPPPPCPMILKACKGGNANGL